MEPSALERLSAARIELVAEARTHYLLARDNFIVLVERREDGGLNIGSSGVMTAGGLAYLVMRGAQTFFVGKGAEMPAEPAEVEALRQFSRDVASALRA